MSVISVKLLSASGGETGESVSYELAYHVSTDSSDDGPFTVRSAVGWSYGDPYIYGNDSDPRAFAKEIEESQLSPAHPLDWTVSVRFGEIEYEGQNIENPLLDDVQEDVTWRAGTRLTMVDRFGNLIANTAGVPFSPQEIKDNKPYLSYSWNQSTFPFSLANQVQNAVNTLEWKGYAAGTVQLAEMRATRAYHRNAGNFYKVRADFEVNENGFEITTPSIGYSEKTDSPDPKQRWKPILEKGKQIRVPVALAATGKELPADTPPVMLAFDVYPRVDFNALFPML